MVGSAGSGEAAPVNGQILFGVAWPERLDWRDESPKDRQVEVCGIGLGGASSRWTVAGAGSLALGAVASPTRGELAITVLGAAPTVARVEATRRRPLDLHSGAAGSWSPDGARVAFVDGPTPTSPPSAPSDIFTMNRDGSDVRQLTTEPFEDFSPDWSPDGTKIAFASDRSGSVQIYVMKADGSNPQRLTSVGNNGAPKWSPDGARILFVSDRNGSEQLYVMRAEGTDVDRLGIRGRSPVWSPDGRLIAFNRDQRLHVVRSDGSGDRVIYGSLIEWGPSDWASASSAKPAAPCIRWGTSRSDRLIGTRFDDVSVGRAGDDRIEGAGGSDQLIGDVGNDRIDGGAGGDWIDGGEGADWIDGGSGADHLFGGPAGDELVGGSGSDTIEAGPGNDIVRARDGRRDVIRCGTGRDVAFVDRLDHAVACERVIRR